MPVDKEEEDLEKGNLPVLKKHHWLKMYEALVEFKKKNGKMRHKYLSSLEINPLSFSLTSFVIELHT